MAKKLLLYFATGMFCLNATAQVDLKLPSQQDLHQIMQANQQLPIAMPGKGQTMAPVLEQMQTSAQSPKKQSVGSDLLVFVSASMPPDTIRNYSRQAKEYGAVMVLRGFVKDKMSETRKLVTALNAGGAEWMIQPQSFKLFKVDRVPTIVLSMHAANSSLTEDGCAAETEYVKISGDVGIGPALNTFASKAQPDLSKAASHTIADYHAKYAPKGVR